MPYFLILVFLAGKKFSLAQNPIHLNFALILAFVLICTTSQAQDRNGELSPMEQFRSIDQEMLDEIYLGANVDSARCMQMLSIAQGLNNDSLLAISYNWLGSYFDSNKGDNITAFEYYFKALPYALAVGDKRRISSIYFDISNSYFDLKNYDESLRNTKAGWKHMPTPDHPKYYWMLIQYQLNMAQDHIFKNNPDSTLYYANKVIETNSKVGSVNMVYQAHAIAASAYSMLQEYDLADQYFELVEDLSDSVDRNQSLFLVQSLYLPHLLTQNKFDDVEKQSRALVQEGRQEKNNNLVLLGATYLRDVFELKGQLDSAYFYSKLESEINSRIYNQNNINKIQALEFSESIRKFEEENQRELYESRLRTNALLGSSFTLIVIAFLLYRNNRAQKKSNRKTEIAYERLQSTQTQLIHSEKMASLGELTAGIAHEIQNPLNFVNNFSDVNKELAEELMEEIKKGNGQEAEAIIKDIIENEEKIMHHGKRADGIVKGMLQHSRAGGGEKEPTDINALADEYLRLAYHGLRAKDKSFNADFKTELDPDLPKVNVVPQDIGRVLLNLINNAFFAVSERSKSEKDDYKPTVILRTTFKSPLEGGRDGLEGKQGGVQISIKDNGLGIPNDIKDKIFQPFFTTKSTGEGTGLGLSLSYDIITKGHGGEIEVESQEDQGSEFNIILPVK
jgi:signal transduction histidine kinase